MIQIYEDTRQQQAHGDKHANKHAWWKDHGVEVERRKLEFGDYVRADGMSNIAVDTKRSIDEVAGNVGREHDRFVRELDKARDAGYRLIILIEVGAPYKTIEDIKTWVSGACKRCAAYKQHECDPTKSGRCYRYRVKPMQGVGVYSRIKKLEHNHGCIFEICRPGQSARHICNLLGVEYER